MIKSANLAVVFDLIARDRASSELRKVGDAADDAGGKTDKFSGIAKAGLAAVAGGAVAFAAASIQAGGDFDKTMRQVAAVTGEPKAGLKDLSALALKMGADTKFSAGEAGDAMLELAKGGLSTADIRAGALNSTLTLAAAGGVGLGEAATFMSNSLNTFGLNAKDAGQVAAALAGGANASSASVESLGQALSQVGPGAKTAGLSIQETVAALAAFDNAGIKGSDAGTSLKTMLSRLVPTTKASATAMRDLGIDFTNADGSFKSLAEVSEILKTKLGGLSAEQKSQALTAIFGSDATRAATVLMNEGAEGIEKYTKATSDQSAAQRIAKAAMEGQSGAIEAFKGSVETLLTTAGIALAPVVTKIAELGTTVVNGVVPAFKKVTDTIPTPVLKVLGVVVGTVTAAIVVQTAATLAARTATGLWSATTGLFTTVKTAEGVVVSRGTVVLLAHNVAMIASRIATIASTVASVAWTVALTALAAATSLSTARALIATAATTAWTAAQTALNFALRANPIGLVITAIGLLAVGIYTAFQRSENFRSAVDKLWEFLKRFIGFTPLGFLIKNFDDVLAVARKVSDKVGEFFGKMRDFKIPGWVKDLGDLFGGIAGGIGKAFSALGSIGDGPGLGGVPNESAKGEPPGVQRLMSLLPAGTRLISGFRPGSITATGNPSYHGKGRAVDLPPSLALFNYIKSRFGAQSKELIFTPAGDRQVHNGREHRYTGVTARNHIDHVHWAMANGGVINEPVIGMGLNSGKSYAFGERGPETVTPGVKNDAALVRELQAQSALLVEVVRYSRDTRDMLESQRRFAQVGG